MDDATLRIDRRRSPLTAAGFVFTIVGPYIALVEAARWISDWSPPDQWLGIPLGLVFAFSGFAIVTHVPLRVIIDPVRQTVVICHGFIVCVYRKAIPLERVQKVLLQKEWRRGAESNQRFIVNCLYLNLSDRSRICLRDYGKWDELHRLAKSVEYYAGVPCEEIPEVPPLPWSNP